MDYRYLALCTLLLVSALTSLNLASAPKITQSTSNQLKVAVNNVSYNDTYVSFINVSWSLSSVNYTGDYTRIRLYHYKNTFYNLLLDMNFTYSSNRDIIDIDFIVVDSQYGVVIETPGVTPTYIDEDGFKVWTMRFLWWNLIEQHDEIYFSVGYNEVPTPQGSEVDAVRMQRAKMRNGVYEYKLKQLKV